MYINQWVMGSKSVNPVVNRSRIGCANTRPENRKRIVIRFGSVSVREGLNCVKFWSSLAVKKIKRKVLRCFQAQRSSSASGKLGIERPSENTREDSPSENTWRKY